MGITRKRAGINAVRRLKDRIEDVTHAAPHEPAMPDPAMMTQRDHLTGAAFFGVSLAGIGGALLAWVGPGWTAVGLAVAFVPAFVASHGAAELLGAAWDRWGHTASEPVAASDTGRKAAGHGASSALESTPPEADP